MLVIFAVLGGAFIGNELQTTVIRPPTQVVGICAPPAYISGFDCLQKICTTNSEGNQVCNVQNAGYIIGPGGTVTCNNGICVGTP